MKSISRIRVMTLKKARDVLNSQYNYIIDETLRNEENKKGCNKRIKKLALLSIKEKNIYSQREDLIYQIRLMGKSKEDQLKGFAQYISDLVVFKSNLRELHLRKIRNQYYNKISVKEMQDIINNKIS